jgi:peptidoglycan/LPS O-acetylase OafA/YrhL
MNFKQIDYLLSLRGLLALAVFLSHIEPPSKLFFIFGINIRNLLIFDGVTAVRVFFVLSGYLMIKGFVTHKYYISKTGVLKFYKSRFLRIAPLYYTIAIINLVFIYNRVILDISKLFSIFSFSFYEKQSPYFTGAFWSLSVEIWFYAITPVLYMIVNFIKKHKIIDQFITTLIILFINILITLLIYSNILTIQSPQVKIFIEFLVYFQIGGFINLCINKKSSIYKKQYTILLIVSFLTFVVFFGWNQNQIENFGKSKVSVQLFFPIIVGLFCSVYIWLSEKHSIYTKSI